MEGNDKYKIIKTMSITELLGLIDKYQRKVEDIYHNFLDPKSEQAAKAKSLVNLYYLMSNKTIKGLSKEDTIKSIEEMNDMFIENYFLLQKLLTIREQVNSQLKVTINNPWKDDSTITLSVNQILSFKSEKMRNYYYHYLQKLSNDLRDAEAYLDNYTTNIMNNERIETYVVAKMNSLNMSKVEDPKKINYAEFAKEYIEANQLELLDPLNIAKGIEAMKQRMDDFYSEIEIKLYEINSITKIYVDTTTDLLWSFVKDDMRDFYNLCP